MNNEWESCSMTTVTTEDISIECLTKRQQEILKLLALGDSVKEAARKLYLAPKSVEGHKHRIMKKLEIHDRVLLARYAIRNGLILP
ncbi:MAG: response regulator transcription factor [Planctomycetes bacterium]|nr:response regulator transcription factor [Planctomycetota bacterium]